MLSQPSVPSEHFQARVLEIHSPLQDIHAFQVLLLGDEKAMFGRHSLPPRPTSIYRQVTEAILRGELPETYHGNLKDLPPYGEVLQVFLHWEQRDPPKPKNPTNWRGGARWRALAGLSWIGGAVSRCEGMS